MGPELIHAIFQAGSAADLGPRVRPDRLTLEDAADRTVALARACGVAGRQGECLKALVLLWHDHLDEAHALVQDLPGPDAAFVHGIMHRREPDYSNARYWFSRVGEHPAFEPLADAAAPVLAAHASLPFRLIRDGRWDGFAFIDAVSAACRSSDLPVVADVLRELQRLESVVLARHLAGL